MRFKAVLYLIDKHDRRALRGFALQAGRAGNQGTQRHPRNVMQGYRAIANGNRLGI